MRGAPAGTSSSDTDSHLPFIASTCSSRGQTSTKNLIPQETHSQYLFAENTLPSAIKYSCFHFGTCVDMVYAITAMLQRFAGNKEQS
jgi:hypothetical protein